jgi:ABC-type sugar transport system ATPase subunit
MIDLENVAVRAGEFSLDRISLHVPAGQCAMLMGRSGCGKTTLLECIGGLRTAAAGRILLDGRDVTRLGPAERQLGYVPQDLALFPTMTVRQHLEFALVIRRWGRRDVARRVTELAEMLALAELLHRKTPGLSGGESQRVALGRALAFHPRVLLLDEPLSALDDDARESMYDLLGQVQRLTGVTTLHVTHSRREAARLGDVVLRLEAGRIEQSPSPSGRGPG